MAANTVIPLPVLRQYQTKLHSVAGQVYVQNPVELPAHSFAFDCPPLSDFGGMSGSAVWNLNLHRVGQVEAWNPAMSEFAGVVTQADKVKGGFIVATGGNAVRNFLPRAFSTIDDRQPT